MDWKETAIAAAWVSVGIIAGFALWTQISPMLQQLAPAPATT